MVDAPAHSIVDLNAASSSRDHAKWAALGLGASLCVPSLGVVQRYFGNWGTLIYVLAGAAGAVLLLRYRVAVKQWAARRSQRQVIWLTGLTFVVILAAFIVVYPMANSNRPGAGSDGDDALNVAVNELIHGRYPYHPSTYLDNPISPLPGAVLLAVPFVLLGSSAYQNLFWMFAFFMAMRTYLHGSRSALMLLWIILVLSPAFWYALVTGSDYIANALYVLLFSLWLIQAASRPRGSGVRVFLFAGLLGVGLSSRANFILLMPLMFVALGRVADWKTAITLTLIVGLTLGATTLPFYLFDPGGFSPLHTTDELGRFDVVLPHAGLIIPLLTATLAILLAFWPFAWPNDRGKAGMSRETHTHTDDVVAAFFRNSALVLALPVICGLVLYCVGLRRLYFGFATFGVFFLFFGAVPAWRTIIGPIGGRSNG